MFKETRRRIIIAIMMSLLLLFSVTLSVILFASYREVRKNNSEKLERYMELYLLDESEPNGMEPKAFDGGDRVEPKTKTEGGNASLTDTPPWKNGGNLPPEDRPEYQLSTFYSVAFSSDGEVLRIDDVENGIYSEEELVSIARGILEQGKSSGTTRNLLFGISQRPGYVLVALLDITVAESNLSILLRNVLIVGCSAMLVLFFVALFISGKIVRPLEESDRKQKQFISDASHELKTPLSVIGANAEMLSREIGKNEWLDNILYENDRMGNLVKHLLDLSRAEGAESMKEQLDISRIADEEMLVFESLAFDQGRTIEGEIEEGIRIMGNRAQIQQLVSILLDNAIRHSKGTDIKLVLKHQSHFAVLSVENEGESIPPEKQKHLFDRFYRVDEARVSEGNHYGLGLSIAKAIVDGHKGSIIVSCLDGRVRFTVSIPL